MFTMFYVCSLARTTSGTWRTGLDDGGFCANDAPRDGPFPSCPSWGMGGEGDWTTWRCVVGFVARMLLISLFIDLADFFT